MKDATYSKTFISTVDGSKFEYGFHFITGNSKPYFFISVEEYDERGRLESVGTPSEEMLREAAPQLAGLIRWRLCDIDGIPMHYVANARYWANEALKDGEEGDRAADCFKKHVILGACASDARNHPHTDVPGELESWLAARLPDLKNAFQADLAGHELWGPAQKWWENLQK